jgi:hypothetical protein
LSDSFLFVKDSSNNLGLEMLIHSSSKRWFLVVASLLWRMPFFHVGWKRGSWSVFPKWWGFQHAAAVVGGASNVIIPKGVADWGGPADPGGELSQTRLTYQTRGNRIGSMTSGQEPETAISWTSIMVVIVRMCRK